MKKFYPIVRRKFQRELLLIVLLIFLNPTISKATSYNTNLVTNGNAENPTNLYGWIQQTGTGFSSFNSGSDPTPKDGSYIFDYYINANASATLTQTINISDLSTDISNGKVKAVLTGWIYKMFSSSIGRITLEELNSLGGVLSATSLDCSAYGTWESKNITKDYLNTSTRQIRITLYGYVVSGAGDFVDFDVIDLKLYKYATVTTTAAASITTASATLGGNVTADGSPANTERGVVYSTTNNNPTIGGANVTKVAIASGAGLFSQSISGLSGAQIYYFNAYAINTAGTVYGTAINFTTLTPTVTTATTNTATNVTINTATLNGSVNANNYSTTVTFQYGLTTGYGTTVTADQSPASGSTATSVSKSISGLASSTTYNYRVVAQNVADGTKYGANQTFTTLTPVSEIGLKQGSTTIADGGSYDFGFHQPSTNKEIMFTIENTGTGVLTLTTPLIITGTNANQFSIQSQPSSSVAVSGSTTFTVRFTPTSMGNKTATISFTNNDSNENPFDLTISGAGYLPATVTTNAANYSNRYPNGIVATGMTVNGSVNANNSSTAVTFEYGLTTSYGSSVAATPSPVTGMTTTSVSSNLTGLSSNTLYHYRAVGTNLGGPIYGSDQTFTTPILENFIGETDEAKTFTEGGTSFSTTGYLKISNSHNGYNGSVVDDYYASNNLNSLPTAGVLGSFKNLSNYFFSNSIWVAPGIQDAAGYLTIGQYGDVIIRGKRSGTTLFTHTLLSSATNTSNYTFVNLSSYNTILIDELEFEVTNNIRYMSIDAFNFNYLPAFAPTVTTQPVAITGTTTATSHGNITNLGSPNPTVSGICWNTSTNPTTANFKTTDGPTSSTGAFTGSLTSLTPGTLYYVKAYATNAAGTSYGNEVTFSTLTNGTWTGTSSTDWATATNWAGGSVPTSATDVTIPSGKNPVIGASTSANCRNLTVEAGGSLTVESSSSGTGSLIVSGTSTGNVTCQRYMTGNVWHLVSSPVDAQDINTLVVTDVATNAVAMIDPKYGLAPYNNTTPGWAHYTTSTVGAAGNFIAGKGYEVLRTGDGTVTFTGTVPTDNVSIAITKNTSGWNLVGNPFTSSINGNSPAHATNNFLTANTAPIDASYRALYVWDAASGTYLTVNHTYNSNSPFYVATGQAFFVYSVAGGSTVNFTEAMQTHQTGNIFKNAVIPNPSIKLIAQRTEGATSTNILYLEAMTTGLDPGYDAGRFSGGDNGFAVYTHLVGDNSNSVDFDIQCLPDNNWDQVIPIGLNAPENTEIVFRTETVSLPTDVSVFLEDKATGSFTALSGPGNVYRVKTDTKSQGTGRFFLHTKTSATGIELPDKKVNFSIIPRPQHNTLRVIGQVGKNTHLEVYDMAGRKMLHKILNETEINDVEMKGLTSGIYVVFINYSTQRVSKKFSWIKN